MSIVSPEGNETGRSTIVVTKEFEEPSKRNILSGGIAVVGKWCIFAYQLSIKQCVEPESTRAEKVIALESENKELSVTIVERGFERAAALSLSSSAQEGSTQSSACAEH